MLILATCMKEIVWESLVTWWWWISLALTHHHPRVRESSQWTNWCATKRKIWPSLVRGCLNDERETWRAWKSALVDLLNESETQACPHVRAPPSAPTPEPTENDRVTSHKAQGLHHSISCILLHRFANRIYITSFIPPIIDAMMRRHRPCHARQPFVTSHEWINQSRVR